MNKRDSQQVAYALLESLVPVLLRLGVTQGQFNAAMRTALVHEAAKVSRLKNGRVNQSQIAAATGLSRVEVRKHLVKFRRRTIASSSISSTTSRVIQGWKRDPGFSDASGRPRTLRFSGAKASFTSLVLRYGGDVPPRAMAIELKRQGRVTIDRNRVTLRSRRGAPDRISMESLDREVAAVNALLLSIGPATYASNTVHKHFVDIPARDELERDMLRERARNLIAGAIEGLEGLRNSPLSKRRGGNRCKHRIKVAFVVSDH